VIENGKQKTVVKVRMMFGEIEKGELKVEKETWVKGLLWYARPRGIVPTSTPRTPIEEFDIPLEHSGSGKFTRTTKWFKRYVHTQLKKVLVRIDQIFWRSKCHFLPSWRRLGV